MSLLCSSLIGAVGSKPSDCLKEASFVTSSPTVRKAPIRAEELSPRTASLNASLCASCSLVSRLDETFSISSLMPASEAIHRSRVDQSFQAVLSEME